MWLFYRERYVFNFINGALFFTILSTVLVVTQFLPTEALVTLHYNYFYCIDFKGVWYRPHLYLVYLLAVLAINFILAFWIFSRDKYMSYYLTFAGLIVSIIFCLYMFLLTRIL